MYTGATDIKRLEAIDWTLLDAWTLHGVHDFHWFRAKFIPQIPAILINHFTKPDDVVLDPFCGCGTTLVESLRFGRKSFGVDIVPLACLISKVKTHLINPMYLKEKSEQLLKSLKKDFAVAFEKSVIYEESKGKLIEKIHQNIPGFPNKEKWYHPKTLKQLGLIKAHIKDEKAHEVKDFYTVCFSSILKRCSSQTEHWGYVADNMVPRKLLYRDTYHIFEKKLRRLVHGMETLYEDCEKLDHSMEELNQSTKVYNVDARNLDLIDSDSVDLVVTSPPYPNVTDQTKMHRLSFYWLGHDMSEINWLKYDMRESKKKEIGARWKRGRKNALEDYFKEMSDCISEIWRAIRKNGYFCIVLGNPLGDDARSRTIERLVSDIKNIGFAFITRLERKVVSQAIAAKRVPEEEIIIFQK